MSNQKKHINLKLISYILTTVFLVSLIPLCWIGIYNFPSSDDFSIGMAASQVWQRNHSVFDTIFEGFRETGRLYMGWTGTFSTALLMALCPAVFSASAYMIVPYLMIGLLSFSIWYFIRTIVVHKIQGDMHLSNIISMIILFFTIQGMPSAVEGFYWYTGAVHYIFPHSFLLLFLGILIQAKPGNTKGQNIGKLILLSLLGIFIGGGNYMTALLTIILCCLFLSKWIIFKESGKKAYLIPFAFTLLSFLLNVFAPGNSVRQNVSTGFGPIKAIYMSFVDCFYFVWDYALGWKTLCLLLLLLPFCFILVKKTKFSFPYPIVVIVISYCILSSIFAPCLYGVGNVVSGRLQNTIYITYMILLVINYVYILGWISKKVNNRLTSEFTETSKLPIVFFSGAVIFTITISCIFVYKDTGFYHFASAISSLQSGQAAQYGAEGQERLEILLDHEQKDIVLHPFTDPPYLLYYEDITGDENDWRNRAICDFYGKNSAILIKE